jgi:uncharacterized membrane protein YhhN
MSERRRNVFIVPYVITAIVNLVGVACGIAILSDISKPLIVPFLGGYYMAGKNIYRSKPLLVALMACWIGDVALMLVGLNANWFLVGLASFLVGHIFYIITYRQHRSEAVENGLLTVQKIRASIPVVLAGTGLVVILYPHLDGLQFPVMIYATAIIIMVMNAIFRFGRTNARSFWLTLSGSIIFMVSDAILAINKFMGEIDGAGVIIMLTYIVAQFLIVEGLRRHD